MSLSLRRPQKKLNLGTIDQSAASIHLSMQLLKSRGEFSAGNFSCLDLTVTENDRYLED